MVDQKIKVVHIITRLDMGGSAQNTLLTALNHDPHRYSVCLIKGSSHESAMTEEETQLVKDRLADGRKRGVEVIDFPFLVRRLSPFNDVKTFISIFRLLQRSKPQIVHTHTSKAGILGRLAGWMARVPIIIHTPHGHVLYGHFGKSLSVVFLQTEKLLGKITDHHIGLTPDESNDYWNLKVSKPSNTSVIHSGVDIQRFSHGAQQRIKKREELSIPTDSPVIGYVGWFIPIKGVTYLVSAMKKVAEKYPKSLLVLVGKGDDRGREEVQLKKQVADLGLVEKVRFLGWRPDVDEIMGCFDIFILPSLNEGMGRVLVEAMAAGLPIVASRVGGIPNLVKDGKNGLLVPPADPVALENAISSLLENKETRNRMGQAGTKMCRQYSTEAMVEQIDDLYMELLEKHSRKPNTRVRFLLDKHSEEFK